jgi:hypothetical protein
MSSANNLTDRNKAWRDYQSRLGNLTEREEAQIERAFMAGWLARSALIPQEQREVEQ